MGRAGFNAARFVTCDGRRSRERPRRRQATLLHRRSSGSSVDRLRRGRRWLGTVRAALELTAQGAAVMLAREIDHRAFRYLAARFGERAIVFLLLFSARAEQRL